MSRLLALVTCAALANSASAACFVPDNTAGKDAFQNANSAYLNCKKGLTTNVSVTIYVAVTEEALCTCAMDQYTLAKECDYPWIIPWLQTVKRDKYEYCASASASSASSLSGSDQSLPSSHSSIDWSSGSQSSNAKLTLAQKLLFTLLGLCVVLLCAGAIFAVVQKTGRGGKKAKSLPNYADYGDDQNDYEQQQYDQRYAAGPPQYEEAAPVLEQYEMPVVEPMVIQQAAPLYSAAPIATQPLMMSGYQQSVAAPQYAAAPQYSQGANMSYSAQAPTYFQR